MKKSLLSAALFLSLLTVSAVSCERRKTKTDDPNEAWNTVNDPLNLSRQYQRRFASLPRRAELAQAPWSDSYWPSNRGGIAYRWLKSETPFQYATPSEQAVRAMSPKDLAKLSPAEKFDIFRGRFDYPTVQLERQRTSASDPDWTGICHGWAVASALFSEPKNVALEGPSGIVIPFGSSDIKALLSYYVGEVNSAPVRFLGTRCNVDLKENPEAALRPECRDTNAGAFHVVISNQLGLQKKAFVADVTRDLQVWNQPVYGFDTRVVSEQAGASAGAAPGTVREVTVETGMTYSVENEGSWTPVLGTRFQYNNTIQYRYRLELDQNGDIVGGEWLSDERPDFLWIQDAASITGPWAPLRNIYLAATNGVVPPVPTVVPTVVPTAVPTVRPTVAPTAVPTVRPTVVPTVAPTAVPTVAPTAVPTSLPTPVVTPVAPQQPDQDKIVIHYFPEDLVVVVNPSPSPTTQLKCPGDFELKQAGQNVRYCAKNGTVLGPQPQSMQQRCMEQFGRDPLFCQGQEWDEQFFIQVRGDAACVDGTHWDTKLNSCVDQEYGYAPYRMDVALKCQAQGQSCLMSNRMEVKKLEVFWGQK